MIIFGIFILSIVGCTNGDGVQSKQVSETKSTGSTDEGDVLVELQKISLNSNELEIGITVNTHSVDLTEYDLLQITTLVINDKEIKPISAPSLSGHHSNGVIVFSVDSFDESSGDISIESFNVIIEGIPNVEKRVFEWN